MAGSAGARSPKADRIRLALFAGCSLYVLLVAYAPGFTSRSPLVCMSNQVLGLHCPGCGLTRAFACLARLDPVGAVMCNPLIIFAAPFALMLLVDTLVTDEVRHRILGDVPPWIISASWVALFATLAVVFVARITTWLMPEVNPDGWLIPPDRFPLSP